MPKIHFEQEDRPTEMVLVQYEKLPPFCYHCGRIGHALKDCSIVQRWAGTSNMEPEALISFPRSLCAELGPIQKAKVWEIGPGMVRISDNRLPWQR